MAIIRKLGFITAAALAGTVLTAAAASAAPFCPTMQSFFGTVQSVNGRMLTVQTPSGHTADVTVESGAHVNSNGYTLRPGMYVGAFGCVTPNGVFHANEITLATNQSRYNEQISGVVQRIQSGRLIVRETTGSTAIWYVPDTDEFHVGQTVTGTGMIGATGAFYPQMVDGHATAYDTDTTSSTTMASTNTVTLSGTVQRVGTSSLTVWEPASRHSAVWVGVTNAELHFRVGQRVTATGREDRRGTFYVQRITII